MMETRQMYDEGSYEKNYEMVGQPKGWERRPALIPNNGDISSAW